MIICTNPKNFLVLSNRLYTCTNLVILAPKIQTLCTRKPRGESPTLDIISNKLGYICSWGLKLNSSLETFSKDFCGRNTRCSGRGGLLSCLVVGSSGKSARMSTWQILGTPRWVRACVISQSGVFVLESCCLD